MLINQNIITLAGGVVNYPDFETFLLIHSHKYKWQLLCSNKMEKKQKKTDTLFIFYCFCFFRYNMCSGAYIQVYSPYTVLWRFTYSVRT